MKTWSCEYTRLFNFFFLLEFICFASQYLAYMFQFVPIGPEPPPNFLNLSNWPCPKLWYLHITSWLPLYPSNYNSNCGRSCVALLKKTSTIRIKSKHYRRSRRRCCYIIIDIVKINLIMNTGKSVFWEKEISIQPR